MTRVTPSSNIVRLRTPPVHQRALNEAARRAFPRLADFCMVHVATPRSLRCVATAHRTPQFDRDMRTMIAAHIRRDDLASTVASVARLQKPALRPEIYDDDAGMRRGAIDRLQRRLAPISALVVPVMHDGQVLGTLSLCYSHSGRSHGPQHVKLAERLATRIAKALYAAAHAASRLRTAARHARQRTTERRRLGSRN